MRAFIYARYSTAMQSENSIEDQIRLCRERIEREGWTLEGVHTDPAISGVSIMQRPGMQEMLRQVLMRKCDVVVSEALDRISRDQEDVAAIFKRVQFAGASIVTLSEGIISELHVGLAGTMNALFLKNLGTKVRRGLRGRVENKRSGGGISYGYNVVKRVLENGEYAKGEREINVAEAAIIREIFAGYARGISPRAIAASLNERGVPSPSGGEWGASTIYGNRARGIGILNNEMYIGWLIWNRQTYLKDPETGRRRSRINPDSELVRQEIPELRIVDQQLWDHVKQLQGAYNHTARPLWTRKRPKTLLSGMAKCGECGGGYTVWGRDLLCCNRSRSKGSCRNTLTIKYGDVEQMVLRAMRENLMSEEACKEFCDAYVARVNELRMERNASVAGYRAELNKLDRERERMIKAIADGISPDLIRDRSHTLQGRRDELQRLLETTEEAPVLFHPRMADRYHLEINNLLKLLDDANMRAEAGTILRSLIDKIVLTPNENRSALIVDLYGDLAGILSVATNSGKLIISDELAKLQPVNEVEARQVAFGEIGLRAGQKKTRSGERVVEAGCGGQI